MKNHTLDGRNRRTMTPMLHFDPATSVLVRRGVRRGLFNIVRERQWSASLGALLGVFLLVQCLGIGLIAAAGAQKLLWEQTQIELQIRPATPDQDIHELLAVSQQMPFVHNVEYVTREQAFDRARTANPKLVAFIDQFGLENPFTDTITITLRSLADYSQFLSFTEEERWHDILDPTFVSAAAKREQETAGMLRLTDVAASLSFLILLLTGAILIFIVMELTRSRSVARSEEVLVERLAGAHALSILMPFATEATVLMSIAIASSAVVVALLLFVLPLLLPSFSALDTAVPYTLPLLMSRMPLFVVLQLILAPFVAFLGAWLGMHRQLKSPRIALAAM